MVGTASSESVVWRRREWQMLFVGKELPFSKEIVAAFSVDDDDEQGRAWLCWVKGWSQSWDA